MEELKNFRVDELRDPVWYTETMWKRGLTAFPPAIVTCAITGGNQGKEANPALPETVEEQVESATEAYKAGAAMVHIHTRVPDNLGQMSWDPELYLEVNAKIREKCPDLIINNTNICGRDCNVDSKTLSDPHTEIIEGRAEVGSVDVSCYFSSIPMKPREPDHPEPWTLYHGYCISDGDVKEALEKMKKYGVKPEFECFALTDLQYVRTLVNQGWTDHIGGPNWISMVYTTGSNWNLPIYMETLKQCCPKNSMLNIIATGAQQWAILAQALAYGFNIRVGMEDNVRIGNGKKADSNAHLVENAVKLAGLMGRPVATCEQARAMMGLGAPRSYKEFLKK